jgi:hypothetical protein
MEYNWARVGVAVASSPTGPFKFLRSFRPHKEQSRDFTVFKVRHALHTLADRQTMAGYRWCLMVLLMVSWPPRLVI